MKIRYLLDENLSARVVATIQRHYPALDVLRVGDPGAPAFGTLDYDAAPARAGERGISEGKAMPALISA